MSKINEILGINDSYKAPERIMTILQDKEERERVFHELLELHNYDVKFDWFHQYFQEEHADRKTKKQDFTPMSIANILTQMINSDKGIYYEPTAGTGGICIAKWHGDRIKTNPFSYKPSDYLYVCEELSDRALPFLLLNVMVRGMNAVVVHCDVLTRESYGVFLIQNIYEHPQGFSNINVMPYNEQSEQFFNVKFIGRKYENWALEV